MTLILLLVSMMTKDAIIFVRNEKRADIKRTKYCEAKASFDGLS